MIVGQCHAREDDGRPLREKIEGVAFGWFYPFFFVGIGIKFDATALVQDLATMLLVPTFAFLFLLVRGVPVLLYRRAMIPAQRLPFVLASAVPSLSIVVVITEIGTAAKQMNSGYRRRPGGRRAAVDHGLPDDRRFRSAAGAGTSSRHPARRGRSPPDELEIDARWMSHTDAIERDGRRAVDDEDALIERRRAEPEGNRQEDPDDHELSQLDAQVEGDERDQQRLLRQPEVGQHRREAEAVDQAEAERDRPALAVAPPAGCC